PQCLHHGFLKGHRLARGPGRRERRLAELRAYRGHLALILRGVRRRARRADRLAQSLSRPEPLRRMLRREARSVGRDAARIAAARRGVGERLQAIRDARSITKLPEQSQTLPAQLNGAGPVTLALCNDAHVDQRSPDVLLLPQLPCERQALLAEDAR